MPRLTPVSRKLLIDGLWDLGFRWARETDHKFMKRGKALVKVPNPHEGDISVDLLSRILRQAGVSREEWMSR